MRRILPLFLFLCSYSVFPQVMSENMMITENFKDVSLDHAINSLVSKYDLKFFYKEEWLVDVRIDALLDNQPLENTLNLILNKSGLTYELLDSKTVVLFREGSEFEEANIPIVNLSGNVSMANSEQPIPGITVFIESLDKGTITDQFGNYELTIPAGHYSVSFSSISHLDERYTISATEQNNEFDVELFEKTVQLEDVVVSAESLESNLSNTEVGKMVMTLESIKNLPTFLGEVDVSNVIKSLPGVQSVGEGASGFNVRGGNLDQNLILMDGMPVFNSSHLLGFFSIFNPDLVSNFSLYKGSIPASFGGRISSVVEVNMKNPESDKFSFQGGVGPVVSKVSANIPISKGKAAVVLGARFGYPTWLVRNFGRENIQDNEANYSDLNIKYSVNLSKKDILNVSAYLSNDSFSFGGRDSTFLYSNMAFSANYSRYFSDKLSSDIIVYFSNYDASLEERTENRESLVENGIHTIGTKLDFFFEPKPSINLNFGLDFQQYSFQPGTRVPTSEGSRISQLSIANQRAVEIAEFIDLDYKVNENLSISAGLRFSQFINLGEAAEVVFDPLLPKSEVSIIDTLIQSKGAYRLFNGLEPRVSITKRLNALTSVKASYTRTYQYVNLFSNSTAVLPTDVWKPSDNNILPQKADQLTVGLVKNERSNTYQFSLDLFYKEIPQTSEVALGTEVLLNELLVSDIQNAKGRAYGAEMLVRKNRGKVTGWLSYTLSRSERKIISNTDDSAIDGDKYFPSNFDRPHNLNISMNWKASRLWTIASNFVFNSGRPITLPTSSFTYDGVRVFTITERNNFRIPDTHRLDVSITLEGSNRRKRKWNHSFSLSLYNVYGRKNPFSVFFRAVRNTQPRTFRLAVLGSVFPSFTYNFKFQK